MLQPNNTLRTLLSCVILAVGATRAEAGAPAVMAGPEPVAIVDGPNACGSPGARPRLWWDWIYGEGNPCRISLQVLDESKEVIRTTDLGVNPRCSQFYLVCDEDGGGYVILSDTYPVSSWKLVPFTPDAVLTGNDVVVTPDPRCGFPKAWEITPQGELLAIDDCPNDPMQSVALRRFPTEGGTESEPLWLREASDVSTNEMVLDADELGNTVVAWSELWEDGAGDYDSHVFAHAVDARGMAMGETLALTSEGSDWLWGVSALSDGIFAVTATSNIAGGPVRYTLSVDPGQFPVETTTTTTLPPSPDAPDFDLIRTVGPSGVPPAEARLYEGRLFDMIGSPNGEMLLRRSLLQRSYEGSFFRSSETPTQAHASPNAGARWQPMDSAPEPISYEPFFGAASSSGTMLFARPGTYRNDDDPEYWGATLTIDILRSEDGGRAWSPRAIAAKISHSQDFYLQDFTLASNGKGAWMIAFAMSNEQNGGSPEKWLTSIDVAWSFDDGRTWDKRERAWEEIVETESWDIDDKLRPLVTAASGSDGSWGLAWRSEDNGALRIARTSGPDAAWIVSELEPAFAGPSDVDLGNLPDFASPYGRPAFVTTPAGDWILAWQKKHLPTANGWDSDIYVARSDDDGVTWDEPASLRPDPEVSAEGEPSLAVGTDGRVLAVWSSHESLGESGLDADIVSSISNDGGKSWSPPALVDPAAVGDGRNDRFPVAVASGLDTWTVAWTAYPYTSRWEWDEVGTEVRVAVAGSRCGNGALDSGEECDDGNRTDGDGCNSNCTEAGCGNEVTDAGEDCDPSDASNGVTCNPDCTASVCGDGFQNIWTEQCDDGNTADGSVCTPLCTVGYCGDGFVRLDREQCDDANYVNDDACSNYCKLASCGDGRVLDGVEECDDGDGWVGNACTDECVPARCGDGRVQFGVEECDDPDGTRNGGNCSADCKLSGTCSDADASGTTTASDALTILRKAVALADECTPDRCDVNGSGTITAIDASGALRTSAGLDAALECPIAGLASFVLGESPLLGALQFEVGFSQAGIGFGLGDGQTHCEVRIPNAMSAGVVRDDGTLFLGIISLTGFQGPIELARCPVFARHSDPSDSGGQVEIRVDEAGTLAGDSLYGDQLPSIHLVTH